MAYPISGKCLIEPGQSSLAQATLREVGIVDLIDNHGELQRAFPQVSMSDSTSTDQEGLSNGKLYYFRARITPVHLPNDVAYAPERILQLEDANISFERFLELTTAERERLWNTSRPSS